MYAVVLHLVVLINLHFGVKIQTTTTGKPHSLIPDLYSNLPPQDFIFYSVHSCLSMTFLQRDVISLKDLFRSNLYTLISEYSLYYKMFPSTQVTFKA